MKTQKKPLRVDQGRRLVECDRRKNKNLKLLSDHITKSEDIVIREQKHRKTNDKHQNIIDGAAFDRLLICDYIVFHKSNRSKILAKPSVSTYEEQKSQKQLYRDIYLMD